MKALLTTGQQALLSSYIDWVMNLVTISLSCSGNLIWSW